MGVRFDPDFARGAKYLTFSLTSILIYFFLVSWFIPYKSVNKTSINSEATIIESNSITGKTATIMLNDKKVIH